MLTLRTEAPVGAYICTGLQSVHVPVAEVQQLHSPHLLTELWCPLPTPVARCLRSILIPQTFLRVSNSNTVTSGTVVRVCNFITQEAEAGGW